MIEYLKSHQEEEEMHPRWEEDSLLPGIANAAAEFCRYPKIIFPSKTICKIKPWQYKISYGKENNLSGQPYILHVQ